MSPPPDYRTNHLDRLEAALADGSAPGSSSGSAPESGTAESAAAESAARESAAADPTAITGGTGSTVGLDNTVGLSAAGIDSSALTGMPQTVGRYHLLEKIAQGGMGAVFRAEQRSPIQRIVALKLIKLGFDTPEIVRRFESERQALARMDHPNIAKVLDAGADPVTGRPYFVMEYVAGAPLTKYCDQQCFSTRQRLELFLQVCDAVAHAHQKMVVHRDLKPSNILARAGDTSATGAASSIVKVIDFGIAKALVSESGEGPATQVTEVGQIVGTLDYMSPEQARSAVGAGEDIDTRSDIYSLGVVMYELLAGALPFDPQKLRSGGLSGVERMICQVDPPPPSTRFFELGANSGEIARRRQTQVRDLTRELKGELGWIPMKAMRKDRAERYATVAELAEDVRNYLAGLPLRAGPESAMYRARKFLRRNRAGVAVVALIALLLVAGIAGTSWQAIRAEKQRRLAEARFDDIRNLASDFIFNVHGDVAKLPGSQPAVDKLLNVAIELLAKLQADSSDNFDVVRDASVGYARLGDLQGGRYTNNKGDVVAAMASYQKARDLANRALKIRPGDPMALGALAGAQLKIGDVHAFRGDYGTAAKDYELTLQLMEQVAAKLPGDLLARTNVVVAMQRLSTAKDSLRTVAESLQDQQRIITLARKLVADFPGKPEALGTLATVFQSSYDLQLRAGDFKGALASASQSVELCEKLAAPDPNHVENQSNLAAACQMLARVQESLEQLDAAMASQKRALAIHEALFRRDPDNARLERLLAGTRVRCADLAGRAGHFDEARQHFDAAITSYRAILARTPSDRQSFQMLNYALIEQGRQLADEKKFAQASSLYRQAVDLLEAKLRDDPSDQTIAAGLGYVLQHLGMVLADSGDPAAGVGHLRRAVQIDDDVVKSDPSNANAAWNLVGAREALGDALAATSDHPAAREQYTLAHDTAVAMREKKLAMVDPETINLLEQKLAAVSTTAPTTSAAAAPTTAKSGE